MENNNYKRLDMKKLNSKPYGFLSTKEAIKDVTPINWSDRVISGEKKVLVTKYK